MNSIQGALSPKLQCCNVKIIKQLIEFNAYIFQVKKFQKWKIIVIILNTFN